MGKAVVVAMVEEAEEAAQEVGAAPQGAAENPAEVEAVRRCRGHPEEC